MLVSNPYPIPNPTPPIPPHATLSQDDDSVPKDPKPEPAFLCLVYFQGKMSDGRPYPAMNFPDKKRLVQCV